MLERARDGDDTDEMIVAAYIGLSKLQWFEMNAEMTGQLAEEALAAAKQINNAALKGDLHDALARAYISIADTERALGHAQTAYLYWMPQDDPVELGRIAFTLAIAYRNASLKYHAPGGLTLADFFLELAGQRVAGSEYASQYALMAYERGSLCHQRGEYEAAVQWYGDALDEARRLGRRPVVAVSQHGLGIAQTELGEFEQARDNLKEALGHWRGLEKEFEQASVLQALGHLENQSGDKLAAKRHLLRARQMCGRLPSNRQLEILQQLINDTLDEL
jgi:tetratricopeptide (TPR) repeat protein